MNYEVILPFRGSFPAGKLGYAINHCEDDEGMDASHVPAA